MFIQQGELEGDVFTQHRNGFLSGTCFKIIPRVIIVCCVKFIAYLIPIAVNVPPLNVNLDGVIIREFARLSLVALFVIRGVESVNNIVDAEVRFVIVNRNNIQSLMQFPTICVTAKFPMPNMICQIKRRTCFDFTIYHHIDDISVVCKYTRGVVQVGMRIQTQCLCRALGFVIRFVELHTILLGIFSIPFRFRVIRVSFLPRCISCHLAHHCLQSCRQRLI